MELFSLNCFCRFVEEGTVTKAANSMHMSQPNLSRHIIALEKELGQTLYIRDARRAKLTEAGRRLYEYASAITKMTKEAVCEISTIGSEPAGDVYIGFGDSPDMDFVLDAITNVCKLYSGISFHLYAGSSLTLLDRLSNGKLDFVFEVDHMRRVEYEELVFPCKDVWGVYPLPDSDLSKLDAARPEDLAGQPLVCSRLLLKTKAFRDWAGESYSQIRPVVSMDIFPDDWPRLIERRVGHMIGYLFYIDAAMKGEAAKRGEKTSSRETPLMRGIPFDPPLQSEHALIWKKGRTLSSAAMAFLDEMRRTIEGLHC